MQNVRKSNRVLLLFCANVFYEVMCVSYSSDVVHVLVTLCN